MSIGENWQRLCNDVQEKAHFYGRDSQELRIMAVSKTYSKAAIEQGEEAGIRCFAENRVEEAREKFTTLDKKKYPLYFIGHLQSNKAKYIDTRFEGVHSVDSLKLARRLSSVRAPLAAPLEILLEVNSSGEKSKFGFQDRALFRDAIAEISSLPFLHLKGLLTMAPFVNDEALVRRCFARCREWGEDITPYQTKTPILSMGMSSDYPWAIAEGSNLLRIGQAIFGEPT